MHGAGTQNRRLATLVRPVIAPWRLRIPFLATTVACACFAAGQSFVLTNIAAIKQLLPAQASIPRPVHLRGVLTYKAQDVYSVQDSTGAIFIGDPGQRFEGSPGDLVEVSGVTTLFL